MEMYRSGRNESDSKSFCRCWAGTWVRIPPSPPKTDDLCVVGFLFLRDSNRRFPEKTLVAYVDGINALLSACCFFFLRLPAPATGSGRLRRPPSPPKADDWYVVGFLLSEKK